MTIKVRLTAKRIADFECPPEKSQEFMWDADTPNLGVKIRPRGKPAFIYQGSLGGKPLQLVIGSALTWKIPDAQAEARRMQVLVDKKINPSDERSANVAAAAQAIAARAKVEITVGAVWEMYIERGIGKRGRPWSERYKLGLKSAMHAGGEKYPRCGERRTVTGPLFDLRDVPLVELNEDRLADLVTDELDRIAERAREEDPDKPPGYATVKAAVEWLSGMLRWSASQKDYKGLVQGNPARSPQVQDSIPSPGEKRRLDFVEVSQLEKFFQGLAMVHNRTMAGYLVGLLLTGARRQELAKLKWSDIDFELKKFTIADKSTTNTVRTRVLPLAPWLERVIRSMPKVDGNDYVFAAPKSKLGYVQDARATLAPVLEHAGIAHLTPHGLRRTFSLVGEAASCPSGAIEQLMGHSVKSMEEHYKPRRTEQLRQVLERYENFVAEQAKLPARHEFAKVLAVAT